MTLPPRILAYFGFSGTVLDAMGGLYLGYDLFGGRNGPLSLLTRIATYSLMFGIGYVVPLGPHFGIPAGIGAGVILALEFHRISRYQRLYQSSPLRQTPWFAIARGMVLGAAAILAFGFQFGALFGIFCATGLYGISRMGMNPANDYVAKPRLHLNRHKVAASLLRGLVIGLAGAAAAWIETANSYSTEFGLLIGVTVGLVSMLLTATSPVVEWWIDNMPERHLLMMGLGMIFLGLVLQSVQYLVVILGMHPISS